MVNRIGDMGVDEMHQVGACFVVARTCLRGHLSSWPWTAGSEFMQVLSARQPGQWLRSGGSWKQRHVTLLVKVSRVWDLGIFD